MHYSLPLSVTDGASPTTLTTSYQYDFNTSFVNSETDPNNLVTTYSPDLALRVRTISQPTGAQVETFYNDPNYPGKDELIY